VAARQSCLLLEPLIEILRSPPVVAKAIEPGGS